MNGLICDFMEFSEVSIMCIVIYVFVNAVKLLVAFEYQLIIMYCYSNSISFFGKCFIFAINYEFKTHGRAWHFC